MVLVCFGGAAGPHELLRPCLAQDPEVEDVADWIRSAAWSFGAIPADDAPALLATEHPDVGVAALQSILADTQSIEPDGSYSLHSAVRVAERLVGARATKVWREHLLQTEDTMTAYHLERFPAVEPSREYWELYEDVAQNATSPRIRSASSSATWESLPCT